jgi:hypothetical protein
MTPQPVIVDSIKDKLAKEVLGFIAALIVTAMIAKSYDSIKQKRQQ